MRILKIAADFMDSAMNNERLNMGEVVGEMMEPFLIQISHWLVKPFNLTYWGCLYLKINLIHILLEKMNEDSEN